MVSSNVVKGVAVVVGLLVVTGGALGAYALSGGVQEPTVENVDVHWGEVSQETSEIQATVVVDNPNAVGVPAVIDIAYTASLNDVVIAEGEQTGVGLSTGESEIELTIPLANEQIPPWWVTHVNNGERSTLAIDATVKGPLGVSMALPTQERAFETGMLDAFGSTETTEVALLGEPFLVVGERTATWGEATAETTPLTVGAEVTNQHDRPIAFDGVGYAVTMNGITMGEGASMDGFEVAPGETATLEIPAALDTGAFDDWWVSHLQGDEQTTLQVETYAIVEGGADDPTVELDLMTMGLVLQTDLLGGGGAATQDVTAETGGGLEYEAPTASVGSLEWGAVTDATTDIEAGLAVDNPNAGSPLNELVDLTVRQSATINDVPVADDTTTIEDLPAGQATETMTVSLDNSKVPEWWARHVNNGETSTVTIDSAATVDVGVTSFDLDLDAQERQFSTDVLADMNGDRTQVITVRGKPAATLTSTSAAWGEADAEETPIEAAVTLRNDRQFVDLTVSDVSYTITMNDVTVADGTDPTAVTIGPGETDSLAFTMVLDSTAMDEWWVSHIEHGESTALSVELTATVEVGGETETVTFDFLGGDTSVETDVLGNA